MKTLHLILTRNWFDRHLDDKTEDYRAITPYWCSRLLLVGGKQKTIQWWKNRHSDLLCTWTVTDDIIFNLKTESFALKTYKSVTFSNGMTPPVPRFEKEYLGLGIGKGKKEWGAPEEKVFIVKCGKVLTKENI